MATTPQPPHRPAPPPPPLKDPAAGKSPAIGGGHLAKTGDEHPDEPKPTIGVKGEPIEDGSRDPGTIAEEQRKRSAEIEAMGVEAWKDAHDTRSAEDKARSHSPVVEHIENHKAP